MSWNIEMYRMRVRAIIADLEQQFGASTALAVTQHLSRADEELRKVDSLVDGRNRR